MTAGLVVVMTLYCVASDRPRTGKEKPPEAVVSSGLPMSWKPAVKGN